MAAGNRTNSHKYIAAMGGAQDSGPATLAQSQSRSADFRLVRGVRRGIECESVYASDPMKRTQFRDEDDDEEELGVDPRSAISRRRANPAEGGQSGGKEKSETPDDDPGGDRSQVSSCSFSHFSSSKEARERRMVCKGKAGFARGRRRLWGKARDREDANDRDDQRRAKR